LLTTVVSDDPIYAYFDTDEATYLKFARLDSTQRLNAGDRDGGAGPSPVFMGLVGEQGYPHQGSLDFIDNKVDARSSTIHVRAVFDNQDGHFTPGLFARIKLVANDSYEAILIDERAVGNDLGKKYVLVLKTGDTVVVNGLQHVMAGIKVQSTRVAMAAGGAGLAQVAAAQELDIKAKPLRTAAVHELYSK
jgi:multidrug efflux system membrane fusion protein